MGRSFPVGGISPKPGIFDFGCGGSVFAPTTGEGAGFALYKFVREDTLGFFGRLEADPGTARGLPGLPGCDFGAGCFWVSGSFLAKDCG